MIKAMITKLKSWMTGIVISVVLLMSTCVNAQVSTQVTVKCFPSAVIQKSLKDDKYIQLMEVLGDNTSYEIWFDPNDNETLAWAKSSDGKVMCLMFGGQAVKAQGKIIDNHKSS